MIVWQLQCYLVHTHMLHEDMTSDYRKIDVDVEEIRAQTNNCLYARS